MAKREIIKIDAEKCNGCGLCIPNCPEGALKIIDGKARLINDLFCDGLGTCLGHCPQGAITIEEREAEKYEERKVMVNITKYGENVIKAHLEHLKEHKEDKYLKEAIDYLKEKGIKNPLTESESTKRRPSGLRQWPIQLHLISSEAPYYQKADLLFCADCVAYAQGDFHKDFLKGKSLAIACPKLDGGQDMYREKIKSLLDDAKINTLSVMTMDVPCCYSLVALAQEAAEKAKRKVPIKSTVVSLEGDILS